MINAWNMELQNLIFPCFLIRSLRSSSTLPGVKQWASAPVFLQNTIWGHYYCYYTTTAVAAATTAITTTTITTSHTSFQYSISNAPQYSDVFRINCLSLR
jgi:hypothetical protein